MTIQEMLEHAPDHLLSMLDVSSISSKAELLDKCDMILTIYHDHLGPKGYLLRNQTKQWEKEVAEIRVYMNYIQKCGTRKILYP